MAEWWQWNFFSPSGHRRAAAFAAKGATTTILIVFGISEDPVRVGFVTNLAPACAGARCHSCCRELIASRIPDIGRQSRRLDLQDDGRKPASFGRYAARLRARCRAVQRSCRGGAALVRDVIQGDQNGGPRRVRFTSISRHNLPTPACPLGANDRDRGEPCASAPPWSVLTKR
jgi:hypothetical protein